MDAFMLFALLLTGGVCLSFLLSGMEAGVLALSQYRIRSLMRTGLRRARLLNGYLEQPENFLWTILVGNTLATFAVLSVAVVVLLDLTRSRVPVFLATFGAVVLLFYVFCDLLPKMLFRQFPTRLCLAAAVPFRLLHLALSPLVALVTWFSDSILRWTGGRRFRGHIFGSRAEVRMAIQESAQNLSSEERAMVNRVLDLQDLTVRSITVPLERVFGVAADAPLRDLLEICRREPLNRIPVWRGHGRERRVAGIINLSSVLYADHVDLDEPAGLHARPPLQLREDVRLEEALRRMQRTRQRMAVVFTHDQRELGIVSLRDILKSIFGEVTL
jgi:putative hemolysin